MKPETNLPSLGMTFEVVHELMATLTIMHLSQIIHNQTLGSGHIAELVPVKA